jgi:hypothetical protein
MPVLQDACDHNYCCLVRGSGLSGGQEKEIKTKMQKDFRIIICALSAAALLLTGCGKNADPSKPRKPGVADYLLGGEDIKAFQKAKVALEQINKSRKEQTQ